MKRVVRDIPGPSDRRGAHRTAFRVGIQRQAGKGVLCLRSRKVVWTAWIGQDIAAVGNGRHFTCQAKVSKRARSRLRPALLILEKKRDLTMHSRIARHAARVRSGANQLA